MSMRKISIHLEEPDGRTIAINIGALRLDSDLLCADDLIEIAKQFLIAAQRKFRGA